MRTGICQESSEVGVKDGVRITTFYFIYIASNGVQLWKCFTLSLRFSVFFIYIKPLKEEKKKYKKKGCTPGRW